MKCPHGWAGCAWSLALAAGGALAAGTPAGATTDFPLPSSNVASGSFAPTGIITTSQNGLAAGPPATTTIVTNVNISGLLSTGITTDTAGPGSASAKVSYPVASTSWTAGPTTYTLAVTASQVASSCALGPLAATASIVSGVLTETARTGTSVSSQAFNLPQVPAVDQTYGYHGATVILNDQTALGPGSVFTGGIRLHTPAQTLFIAATGCGNGPI